MGDEPAPPKERADSCGITPSEAAALIRLANYIAIRSEMAAKSSLPPAGHRAYLKTARIVHRGDGGFATLFTHPHLVRGQYRIDYAKLERLKSRGELSRAQGRRLAGLLSDLELINARKDILLRIINGIVRRQKAFLASGDPADLAPLMQKELAAELSAEPSTVCRALSGRTLETPWGEEIRLADFFPPQKKRKKDIVAAVLERRTSHLSDREIAEIAMKGFGVRMSRRAVGNYRRELAFRSWSHRNGRI